MRPCIATGWESSSIGCGRSGQGARPARSQARLGGSGPLRPVRPEASVGGLGSRRPTALVTMRPA